MQYYKWTKDPNRHFTKENVAVADTHIHTHTHTHTHTHKRVFSITGHLGNVKTIGATGYILFFFF